MTEFVHLSLDDVHALASRVLQSHRVCREQAVALADTLTAAERDECPSHGLFRLPAYLAAVKSGRVDVNAVPQLTRPAAGVIRVDARMGFAPLALAGGTEPLVETARELGIATLAVVNSFHFAPLWPEVEAIAERGMAVFAFLNNTSLVAPAGGKEPLFGTNPMAFGWPRSGKLPLVFDQASSASARGEILMRQRRGENIPFGWAVDKDGMPTTDPAQALAGAQLPFAGHKGSAIAIMIELLAGPLLGEALSFESSAKTPKDGGPAAGGEFLIAIDPARHLPDADREAQLSHAERLFERILSKPGTRLPSDRRYAARARSLINGVEVDRSLYERLCEIAATQAIG